MAALVRSRTDQSLYTPHAGVMMPGNGTRIPAAAITAEDAHIMARHIAKGGGSHTDRQRPSGGRARVCVCVCVCVCACVMGVLFCLMTKRFHVFRGET